MITKVNSDKAVTELLADDADLKRSLELDGAGAADFRRREGGDPEVSHGNSDFVLR
jgi:hypothetical protein